MDDNKLYVEPEKVALGKIKDPDPFVVTFTSGNSVNTLSFHSDGRVTADMPDADTAARQFLDYITKHYLDLVKYSKSEIETKLQSPTNVYDALLRGHIAKPTWEQIKHLYPEETVGDKIIDYVEKYKYATIVKKEGDYCIINVFCQTIGSGKTVHAAVIDAFGVN